MVNQYYINTGNPSFAWIKRKGDPGRAHRGHSGQNGTARYIVTDFLENFKISKYLKLHA